MTFFPPYPYSRALPLIIFSEGWNFYPTERQYARHIFDDSFFGFPNIMQPVEHYNKRKAWQSSYDPRFHQKGGVIEVKNITSLDSLAGKNWVKPANAPNYEKLSEYRQALLKWLSAVRFKYQVYILDSNRMKQEIFCFKVKREAALFKLSWG